MTIFNYLDYKDFLKFWVSERPNGGRGEYRRMAEKLRVSTTLISQVVNGDKHFSLELASDVCDHLALGEREADYFLLLVEYARAGTHSYRQRLKRKIELQRKAAATLAERIANDRDLSDKETAIYYSHWSYTGITNLVACDLTYDVDKIAERLNLPMHLTTRVVNFLLESGILVNRGAGLEVGIKNLHIGASSPLVVKHHQNWRLQAFNKMPYSRAEDLFFTSPMSLSHEAAALIRNELPAFLEKIAGIVGPSPSEVVRCLNIDWFEY
jgi:uncharacterized protein (TIGR02147 family)